VTDDDWELVWEDDFDDHELDPTRWTAVERGANANAELQAYVPDETWVEDGCLVLRSRRRRWAGDGATRDYTSGMVTTRGKFAMEAGRVEVRAQLPAGRGLWPAHWLLAADESWPPAIILTELLGDDPHTVHMTTETGVEPDVLFDRGSFSGPDFSAGFHTFAVEWSPDAVHYDVDGVLRHSTTGGRGGLERPLAIVLNTAVGGRWPFGRPGPGDPDATTELPQLHRIDLVRVLRRAGDRR
jgi:beta-glucanase (GH16 family)